VRLSAQAIDVDDIYWPGKQLLVVYGAPSYVSTRGNNVAAQESVAALRLRIQSTERARVNQQLHQLRGRADEWRGRADECRALGELKDEELAQLRLTIQGLENERNLLRLRTEAGMAEIADLKQQQRELAAHELELQSERDSLSGQLHFVYNTKAWRWTTTYWR